jgi:hypothetical protein
LALSSRRHRVFFADVEMWDFRSWWPDWANFHLLGNCLFQSFFKITFVPKYFGCILKGKSYVLVLNTLEPFFHETIWSPCVRGCTFVGHVIRLGWLVPPARWYSQLLVGRHAEFKICWVYLSNLTCR